jgi:hypothetical protein
MTTDTRIQVRVDDETAEWLDQRSQRMHTGSAHQQARVELGIWRMALRAELRRIRLTLAQANCQGDILNGTLITPGIAGSAPMVFYEVSDAFHLARDTAVPDLSSYGARWGMDEGALLHYLQTLGPTADHALHDAVSRWWETSQDSTFEGWAAVGLTLTDAPRSLPARPGAPDPAGASPEAGN